MISSIVRVLKRAVGKESNKERFSRYAKNNKWRDGESLSGPGSTLFYTEELRETLPAFIQEQGFKSMLDAPCGDFNWMRLVKLPDGVQYIGGEIVPALVKSNAAAYDKDGISFIECDIINDDLPDLPDVDVWMCRDALFHFSYADFFKTMHNLFRSNVRYLLTTSHQEFTDNVDIRTGSFNEMNILLPPYNFPEPIAKLNDTAEGFPARELCLWEVATLKEALADNEMMK
ncbi:MAG: class I SAM-dependent methyltransferase [Planctomycetes bacterium]|nr:class I SAM-dependent methyltransferase [Planctomycetota bacterium]